MNFVSILEGTSSRFGPSSSLLPGNLSLRAKVLDQVLDLVASQLLSECRHAFAAIVYLCVNFIRLQSLADIGQTRPLAATYSGDAMAMNTARCCEELGAARFGASAGAGDSGWSARQKESRQGQSAEFKAQKSYGSSCQSRRH